MMNEVQRELPRYRWVVLAVFSLLTAVLQLQWLTFAPIAREARVIFDATAWQVDALSLVFMAVFLIAAPPASYIIDTFGLRVGISIGALLTGFSALLKGVAGADYTMTLAAQIGLAVAQPFVLNATTKLASQWFPVQQRAIAVGLATMSQFVGIVAVMILTPMMVTGAADLGAEVHATVLGYGVFTAAAAALCLVMMRERPATPPGPEEQRTTVRDGINVILAHRDMLLLLLLFFLGLGMFNAISTCIDQICEEKGLTVEQTGLVGGLMLIAGIIGALVLPVLSDRGRRRRRYLLLSTAGMLPGLLGLVLFSDYALLLVSSFVFGFFLLGGGAPIGFQYAAEVSYPAPESTSQGLILLVGQASGIALIVGVNVLGVTPSLWLFAAFGLVIVALSAALQESPVILVDRAPVDAAEEPG